MPIVLDLGKKPERRRHGESLTLQMKYAFSHFRYFFVAQEFVLKNSPFERFLNGDLGYLAFASKKLKNEWSIFKSSVHSTFVECCELKMFNKLNIWRLHGGL